MYIPTQENEQLYIHKCHGDLQNLHGPDMMTPTQVQMKKAAKEGLLKDIPPKLIINITNNVE